MFEIGHVIDGVDSKNLCKEKKTLAITLFSKTKTAEALYFELRDMLSVLADDLKHTALTFEAIEAAHSYQHPRNLNSIFCDGVKIGEMGVAHPLVSKKIDKKANIVFAEIDTETFANLKNNSIVYEEPSRFPGMEIDLSFVSDTFAPIYDAIEKENCEWIKKVSVTDVYVDETGKSITVRILFSHPDRTLNGDEVKERVNSITERLARNGISMKN